MVRVRLKVNKELIREPKLTSDQVNPRLKLLMRDFKCLSRSST